MSAEDQIACPAGPVLRAALFVSLPEWAPAVRDHSTVRQEREFALLARASVQQDVAIELRLARALAYIRAGDVTVLGYPSWTAYFRERVDLGSSWTRDLIRLINSPLDLIKTAVCSRVISLSTAVLAPGHVAPDDQQDWLVRAIAGDVQTRRQKLLRTAGKDTAGKDTVVDGANAQTILSARRLARLLLGWHAPVSVVDEYILNSWGDRLPASVLVQQARSDPPRPPRLDEHPSWPDVADPATDLLGPWREPADLVDAARMVDDIQHFRRGRLVVVGKAIQLLVSTGAHQRLGYDTVADFARGWFDVTPRTLQRYQQIGRNIERYPSLAHSLEQGLSVNKARLVAGIANDSTFDWWVGLAQQVGRAELERASQRARNTGTTAVQQAYATVQQQTTGLDATAADATATGAPANVALRGGPEPEPHRSRLVVHPDLPEAARWLLDTVQIPLGVGYRKTRDADDHTCQNPECRRRSLRCQVHHTIEQVRGGSHDPWLLVTLCAACHLRLVHGGQLSVERRGDYLVWTWAAGRRVLMHDPMERYGPQGHSTSSSTNTLLSSLHSRT